MKDIMKLTLKDKKVLIRVDFNVPLDNFFNITDDSRIIAALPTIKTIISKGGKAIIMSHLGRPQNGFEKKYSLKHLVDHLTSLLEKKVMFSKSCIGENAVKDVAKMNNGDVLLLENLRFYKEEKSGNEKFAKELAKLGDVYINDAFGTVHRNHASTSVIAQFFPNNKYFGLLLKKEIYTLNKVLTNNEKPFTAIIGGAKISGKIEVIKALFKKVDNLIIGGGMAYTFIKASGGKVGNSLVENEKLNLAKNLIKLAKDIGINLLLPVDSVNASSLSNNAKTNVSNIYSIEPGFMGLDIGIKSINKFSKIIKNSKTIIWNGPMGVFEIDKFENGTKEIGKMITLATTSGAFSLIGGGDSLAAVKKYNLEKNVSYISTGGGAMLEYLEGKPLPGIVAIHD